MTSWFGENVPPRLAAQGPWAHPSPTTALSASASRTPAARTRFASCEANRVGNPFRHVRHRTRCGKALLTTLEGRLTLLNRIPSG